ncbi:MAG: T9SS type A sorting domain-containing protein [Chitinophagales bacterium]
MFFFAKLSKNGDALLYGTYLGGNNEDYGINIRVNPDGAVLVSGSTYSSGLGTNGAWQKENAGEQDAFIAKYTAAGAMDWFTYYGGPDYDRGNGMDITTDDFIYIAGNTVSVSGIATEDAYKPTLISVSIDDGMIARFADRCFDRYEINNSKNKAAAVTIPAATNSLLINAQIDYAKDKDFFSFQNNVSTPYIKISLTDLPANYSLYLLNAAGVQLASSKKTGLLNEEIIFNSSTIGTFLVKVIGANSNTFNDTTCYSLTISLSTFPLRNQLFNEEGLSASNSWELYPCPAADEVNIDLSKWKHETTSLLIYDFFGHVIYREMMPVADSYQFDVSEWQNGCYLVQLLNDDSVSSHILTVVH